MKLADVKIGEIYTDNTKWTGGRRLKALGLVQEQVGSRLNPKTRRVVQLSIVDAKGEEILPGRHVRIAAVRLQPYSDYEAARARKVAAIEPANNARVELRTQLDRLGFSHTITTIQPAHVTVVFTVEEVNLLSGYLGHAQPDWIDK